jgi:hypothetical protein
MTTQMVINMDDMLVVPGFGGSGSAAVQALHDGALLESWEVCMAVPHPANAEHELPVGEKEATVHPWMVHQRGETIRLARDLLLLTPLIYPHTRRTVTNSL